MPFSRNTEKRARSSSNSSNNSFVQNVTSRVTGLLPATITRWFSSPSSSNGNGSTPTGDATDSSTEDEGPETFAQSPPPKRMKYSPSTTQNNHFSLLNPENCVTPNRDSNESCTTYDPALSTINRAPPRRESSVPSPIPSPVNETNPVKLERDSTMFKTQMSMTGPSVSTKRKSLFSRDEQTMTKDSKKACEKSSSNIVKDHRRPHYKPSLLGSPFYPGQTIYGGAASSYVNRANIKQRSLTRVNDTAASNSSVLSQSAQRILDLLENYSSPLIEAKRFAYNVPAKNETFSQSLNRSIASTSNPLSYMTQELKVPTKAAIMRLKQRSRMMETTSAARQLIASQSSMTDFQPYPSQRQETARTETSPKDSKLTTKVKSRLTRAHRGSSDVSDGVALPVNLPDAVLLIDKDRLPAFNFERQDSKNDDLVDTPKKPPSRQTSTPMVVNKPKTLNVIKIPGSEPLKVKENKNNNQMFQFTSPVRISSSNPDSTLVPTFSFGIPEKSVDYPAKGDTTVKKPEWQCPDCWVSNKADCDKCVACGGKPAPKLPDKKPLKSSQTVTNVENKQKSQDWQCPDCWVSNKADCEKCLCCGAKQVLKNDSKESETKTSEKNTIVENNIKDKEWQCPDCWVSNKPDCNKCACCGFKQSSQVDNKPAKCTLCKFADSEPGLDICINCSKFKTNRINTTPKLHGSNGSKKLAVKLNKKPDSALTPSLTAPDSSFKTIVQSQSKQWECTSCFVRNENELNECGCCGNEKHGSAKASQPASNTKFQFGIKPDTSFKFGIDPKLQNAAETKSVFGNKMKPEDSETNNNVLPKTPTFSFGMPAKPANEVPKVNELQTNLFKLPKPQSVVEEERPQEVPKVDLPATLEYVERKADVFTKNSPTTMNPSLENSFSKSDKNPLLSSTLGNQTSEVKDSPKYLTVVSSAALGGFNMAETKATPSPMLFGVPTMSTAAPAAPVPAFGSPLQSTSTMSLFNSTPSITTASNLFASNTTNSNVFQTPESEAKPAPPVSAVNGGMFSFGAIPASSTQQQPEKQVFNFSFGSANKPAAAPSLKPTFGAPTATDNNVTNNFTFAATNNTSFLGGGNGLPASNALGGMNGLPTTTMPGNGMSTALGGANVVPSNTMGAFGLPAANNLQNNAAPTAGLFGNVQKENSWPPSNQQNSNLFALNVESPKPAVPAFNFGAATPFNSGTTNNAFGSNPPQTNNVFVASPSMFGSQANPPPSMFGAAPGGMFGQPAPNAAPVFGAHNTFEQPANNAAPPPAFNFGASQAAPVFGFGQQVVKQQPAQPAPGGVYNFGGGGAQMQFSLGSAPNTAVRRVRKAVRRNPMR